MVVANGTQCFCPREPAERRYTNAMTTLKLQAGEDHVKRLSGQSAPGKALVELVWNALDAEAMRIDISFSRNALGGITRVVVADNGHGFNRNEAPSDFGNIGGSWKRGKQKTQNDKRYLHGNKGQGRLRGFALGSKISWESIAEGVESGLERTVVEAEASQPDRVRISHGVVESGDRSTGTVFVASNETQKGLEKLDSGEARSELLETFAPILIAEPELEMVFDGEVLDPNSNIADDAEWQLEIGQIDSDATIRVIRWKSGGHRRVLFGPSKEQFIAELEDRKNYSALPFTAYASSKIINSENVKDITLGPIKNDESELAQFHAAVESELKRYLAKKSSEDRERKIANWKEQGIYPYSSKPRNSSEQAERALFDTIAVAISSQIPQRKDRAQLTLELLKTSMQNDPESLNRILYEVATLSDRDRKALSILLQETSLPNVIQSANTISRRFKVLAGLESLTLGGDKAKFVQERKHLHMILENELWVFGEGFSSMTSERSLDNLLKTHLRLAGLPTDESPRVTTPEGKGGRTDLHFAVRGREHDRTRHLIVELKRPSVAASEDELSQIKKYGQAIAANPAFHSGKSEWDIILVVSSITPHTKREISEKDTGLFQEFTEQGEPHVRMYVRTWASIIDENRRRLDFANASLKVDPEEDEGLRYLRELYPNFLPEEDSSRKDADIA